VSAGREAYSYRQDDSVAPFADDHPVMIYDGYCGLCSSAVQFVLRHDRRRTFRFIAAQSELGTSIYRHYGLDPRDYETFIVLADGLPLFASDAVIGIGRRLGLPWSMGAVANALPRGVRDGLYFWIARHRMRFFGRRDTCHLPAPDERDRFLA
jgi:predicted DCC family thiol-disulfide oxidoreductase YuxK